MNQRGAQQDDAQRRARRDVPAAGPDCLADMLAREHVSGPGAGHHSR